MPSTELLMLQGWENTVVPENKDHEKTGGNTLLASQLAPA
jgi:hypothetical protein